MLLSALIASLVVIAPTAEAPASAPEVQRPTVQRPGQPTPTTPTPSPETPPPETPPPAPEMPPAQPPTAGPSSGLSEAPADLELPPSGELAEAVTEPGNAATEGAVELAQELRPTVMLAGSGDAWVDVMVLSDVDKRPRPGVRVSLWCESCGVQPGFAVSREGGIATFENIMPGLYMVVAYPPGGAVEGRVEVLDGERVGVRLSLPRDPYRPKNDKGRLNYPGISSSPSLRKAQVPLAVGGVLLVGAIGFAIGAAVEGLVPDCRYGNDNCGGPPRDDVAEKLAIGAGVTGALAIASITWGAINLKRWRYGARANGESASVSVSVRF